VTDILVVFRLVATMPPRRCAARWCRKETRARHIRASSERIPKNVHKRGTLRVRERPFCWY